MTAGPTPALIVVPTSELDPERFARVDALVEAAFGRDFGDIWPNIGPGIHVIAEVGREPVGHAMVVERELHVGERHLRCGYVENVASAPRLHLQGIGSLVMRCIGELIEQRFEVGALATGRNAFYERLGWQTWRGPALVRSAGGMRRTPEHDGDVMLLRVSHTPPLAGDEPISVAWRRGAIW